jgi:hypothetical protein
MQDRVLATQGCMHPQHRFNDALQHRLAGDERADAALEPQLADWPDL